MLIRFLLLLFLVSSVCYVGVFVASKHQIEIVSGFWLRLVFSVICGLLVIFPLFLLNQISGV